MTPSHSGGTGVERGLPSEDPAAPALRTQAFRETSEEKGSFSDRIPLGRTGSTTTEVSQHQARFPVLIVSRFRLLLDAHAVTESEPPFSRLAS